MAGVDLIITNALWRGRASDLLVADGVVEELAEAGRHAPAELEAMDAEVLDAAGLTLMPSCIDVHTHLREPGFEYKEDVASGLGAAAHGGFGSVMCMANTAPVNDDATVTELILEKAELAWPMGPRVYPIGALSKGLKGLELAPMAELAEAGCVAVSNDGLPVASTEFFRRAMEYAAGVGLIVIDHCEDPSMNPGCGMNEGAVSGLSGLPAQPDAAEAIQAARDVLLAEYLGLPVHLAHVSCARTVEVVRWAKARGVDVTAETCPHYLLFTEELAADYDARAKVNPPLRSADDVAALLAALTDGTIDMLATDHAPHAEHEKEVEFDAAPCGISGLDTALASTWGLVADGRLDEETFLRAWCHAPAARFGLPACAFTPGDPADFLLFDPAARWEVTPEAMRSKGKNTPLLGRVLAGRVVHHFLDGQKIV